MRLEMNLASFYTPQVRQVWLVLVIITAYLLTYLPIIGEPKLVAMTHGTFSCTDNDRYIPVPEGRSPQNAAQFNFEGDGKFYSCFLPYHVSQTAVSVCICNLLINIYECSQQLAGVHAYIDLPILYDSATVVFGPTNLPPSGWLLSEILKYQHVRAFYVPPFIIEQWAVEPGAGEQAKQLDFILYGGGPLAPRIGQRLSQDTNVCQMYGSLELGQVQLLVPQAGDWSYMEFNPCEEVDMQPCGDGSFEMVLHQDPKFSAHRSLWHNFPNVKEWRTGDSFVHHPSKSGLWQFHGRLDDLIVLSTSYKLRPVEMEILIQGDPLLSGALIVGQGKPEPLLIVEPKPGKYNDGSNTNSFIDHIWPTIDEANKIAPPYARINRSRVLLADPARPFVRAPKGSIIRKLTTKAYSGDIDAAFADDISGNSEPGGAVVGDTIATFLLPGLQQIVRKHVLEHLKCTSLSDTDNIFINGLDSLGAAALSRSLQREVASQTQFATGSNNTISLRLVYMNPTIEKLARVILNIITKREIPDHSTSDDIEGMERALKDLTDVLPPINTTPYQKVSPGFMRGINVAVIGPRGSVGPNIVNELMNDPRVNKIYCLNRGNDGKELLRSIFQSRNMPCDVDDERISFMPVDLGKPRLGLSSANFDTLIDDVNIIIHNAWRVDFAWTLDSYLETYLRSIRELIYLSSLSALKPRIAFMSSISSTQQWASVFPDSPVAEAPLESYEVASPLGYGQSKHVAERILSKASCMVGTPVTILRVGQVAGTTDPSNGDVKWSTDEWIPSLAAISKVLQLVPNDIPPIDWVPVDVAGRAIVELALLRSDADSASDDQLRVFNIVNPNLSDWSVFARALQRRLNVSSGESGSCCRQRPFTEWVDALVRADPEAMSETDARSSTKILPFFQHLAETVRRGIALQPKFATSEAEKSSRAMREMKKIDEELICRWLEQWGI